MHEAPLLYPGLEGVYEVKENGRPVLSRVPGFVTYLFIYLFMALPHSLWVINSGTRDSTRATAVKALSPNHWTTREFPQIYFLMQGILSSLSLNEEAHISL